MSLFVLQSHIRPWNWENIGQVNTTIQIKNHFIQYGSGGSENTPHNGLEKEEVGSSQADTETLHVTQTKSQMPIRKDVGDGHSSRVHV